MSSNLPEQVYAGRSTDVAVRVPEAGGLDASDITIPRMKVGQKTSRDVLEYGAIYVLESRDDPEPTQLAGSPKTGELGDPVRFYVHGEPRKGWSWKPKVEGGDWRGTEYPDLNIVADNDPRNVRRTYDYMITVVGYDLLPVMFIMHGQWGGQASKQLNREILLAKMKGIELHTLPFSLRARKTSSPKGGQERPFIQVTVGLDKVAAKDKAADLELVETHRLLVGSAANVRTLDDEDAPRTAAPSASPSLD